MAMAARAPLNKSSGFYGVAPRSRGPHQRHRGHCGGSRRGGYFLVGKDDEGYAFGDATSFGSLPPIPCVRDGVRPSGLFGLPVGIDSEAR